MGILELTSLRCRLERDDPRLTPGHPSGRLCLLLAVFALIPFDHSSAASRMLVVLSMTRSFQFRIEQSDAGQRLDEFLASRFGMLSRMRIANLIEAGVCHVNGAVTRAGYRILIDDLVDIAFADDGAPTAMTPEPIPLEVIHEDEHIILVVKPAGMLVHPTMNVKRGTLLNALAYHLNRSRIENGEWRIEDGGSRMEDLVQTSSESIVLLTPILNPPPSISDHPPVTRPGLVHRLDRATSGLIVIAKSPRALTVLSRHFRKRLVGKRYLALVHGNVQEGAGSINAPIGRDPEQRPRWRVVDGGKVAETRFKVLERFGRATLLELEPVTGRTNQLRIHCAHMGHPIIGDELSEDYHPQTSDFEFKTEAHGGTQQSAIPNRQFGTRLCLHAGGLAFHHPVGGEWMEFVSPAPVQMQAIISRYREK